MKNTEECGEATAVRALVTGELPPGRRDAVSAHAEACGTCRQLLSGGAELNKDDVATAPLGRDFTPKSVTTRLELERGSTVGRYLVIEPLGEGGMGVVYAAYDPELHRRVALKLLLPQSSSEMTRGGSAQQRLLREAQALAQLSHPNVVPVFDVGMVGDRVFMAMELIEGKSLKVLMKDGHWSWRQRVSWFVEAGRGLEAAHRAGLVHRDFKPDNVIVGDDGRVRVMDFGIARVEGTEATVEGPVDDAVSGPLHAHPLSTPLTRFGSVLGTVPYMPPEMLFTGTVDHRTDQFSFCVTLYEALYGERPFKGTPVLELDFWRFKVPPGVRVPPHLRKLLAKGLSFDPTQRFSSMSALLEVLQQDPTVARRRWAGAVLTVSVTAAAAAAVSSYWTRESAAPVCQGMGERIAQVWSPQQRDKIAQAFAATNHPRASDAVRLVSDRLDMYARDWTAQRTDACEATRLRGEQSDEVLGLRMACLDRRADELAALTTVLAQADGAIIDQATRAAHALTALDVCMQIDVLKAMVPLPEDAKVRQEVMDLRSAVARGKSLFDAAKYDEALKIAREVEPRAVALKYRPLEAEALDLLGATHEKLSDFPSAVAALSRAVLAAEAGRHDAVKAMAQARLVRVSFRSGKFEEVDRLAEHVESTLERIGGDEIIEAYLQMAVGSAAFLRGRNDEALERFGTALQLRRRALGDSHPEVAAAHNNLGAVHQYSGNVEASMEALVRALEIYERALGPDHPETLQPVNNLAVATNALGRISEAARYRQRDVAGLERAFGPNHIRLVKPVADLSAVQLGAGKVREALATSERSLGIVEAAGGPAQSPDFEWAVGARVNALIESGRTKDALSLVERYRSPELVKAYNPITTEDLMDTHVEALVAAGKAARAVDLTRQKMKLQAARTGEDDLGVWATKHALASALLADDRPQEALREARSLLEWKQKREPKGTLSYTSAVLLVAEMKLALGKSKEALAEIEETLPLELKRDPGIARSEVVFLHARASWAADVDRARALKQAREVLAFYSASGLERRRNIVATWLADKHIDSLSAATP